MAKLKVVMLCHFSNALTRKHIKYGSGFLESIVRLFLHKPLLQVDFAQWNTNAIKEFEKFTDEVELHVISPGYHMCSKETIFIENGIHYYFFKDEQTIFTLFKNKILKSYKDSYSKNRNYISKKIFKIKPDIVYIIGAENPNYSLAALDIPRTIPLMVQLQTLMSKPNFEKKYPISHEEYLYRSYLEKEVIKRADYIGSSVRKTREIIIEKIKPNAIFFNAKLAVGEKIYIDNCEKKYDFVYFSANINKAFDLALEGFALAHKKYPNISLLVVGDYSVDYKNKVDSRIKELGLEQMITFTGRLLTHDNVIEKIREAKFGLIPLKVDVVSGTIREAMANGLPVVTTITIAGTPMLNEKRDTVLLSEIGDHQALADNMIRLIENPTLVEMLRNNGYLCVQELYSNESIVLRQVKSLLAAVNNFKNGTPIPENLLS